MTNSVLTGCDSINVMEGSKRSLCEVIRRECGRGLARFLQVAENKERVATLQIVPQSLKSLRKVVPVSLPSNSTRAENKMRETMRRLITARNTKALASGRRFKRVLNNSLDKQNTHHNKSKASCLVLSAKNLSFIERSMSIKAKQVKRQPLFLSTKRIARNPNSCERTVIKRKKRARLVSFGGNSDINPESSAEEPIAKVAKYLRKLPAFMLFDVSTKDESSPIRKTPEFFATNSANLKASNGNRSRNVVGKKDLSKTIVAEKFGNVGRRTYKLRSNRVVKPFNTNKYIS